MNETSSPAEQAQSDNELAGDPSSDDDSSEQSSSRITQKPKSFSSFWQRFQRLFLRKDDGEALREDISEALKNGDELSSAFSADERAMLDNILLMREVRVENVMVQRADIEAVESAITLSELLTVFESTGHSRMPVFEENLDDPKGMVHIKDLLAYLTKQARNGRKAPSRNGNSRTPKSLDLTRIKLDKTLQESGIVRSVLFVPASMLASDLLKRMQATRTQMALVIDEYGGTDGLVSLEDIVEIVVGDIEDEHDDDDGPPIIEVREDVWQADAKASLEDLFGTLNIRYDKDDYIEHADTLGGLIFAELGRVPVRREVVRMLKGFEFHIMEADARRIKRVRIVRLKTHQRRRPNKISTDASLATDQKKDTAE